LIACVSGTAPPSISAGNGSLAGHYAYYEFADVAEAEALIGSDKIKPLAADFDRVWGDRVSRCCEILEVVQEMAS
jgi:hypothetical protein